MILFLQQEVAKILEIKLHYQLSIEDLKYDSFFFSVLRKPIFQRETNERDPNKVCAMIESFVNGELVPAIILWRNQ